jgi:hypothetical protein
MWYENSGDFDALSQPGAGAMFLLFSVDLSTQVRGEKHEEKGWHSCQPC